MPEGREDTDVTVDTHSLLLSLAGQLDDELLGWCRELVAVGEGDYAIELVTAAVQADRVRLPAGPHEQLYAAASRRQLLGRGETLPAQDGSPRMRHRFLADPASGGFPMPSGERSPEHALGAVPSRLLRNCELWLSWRCTPTGAAPGPLPHPVVLIETDEADGADVLAYQVGEVLLRAGVFASVEVFSADMELGDYHRAALAEAHRVEVTGDRPLPEDTGVSRVPGRPGPAGSTGGRPRPDVPGNGADPRGRDGGRRPEPPRPGPIVGSDGPRSTPLRPVDRVITARSSGPRRPRPENTDRSDTGFDEIASGLTFDRASDSHDDMFRQDAADGATPDRPAGPPPAERRAGEPPREGERRPGPPPRPPVAGTGHFPTSPDRPGPDRPGPDRPGPDRPGPGRPVPPGGGSGKRPPGRPDETSEAPLSDVEQRLLRQLHEELAAREDPSGATSTDGPRIFRGANGGRKPRPTRPTDPPPDRAS